MGYFRANRENRTHKPSAVQNYKKDFQEAVQSIPWNSLSPKAKEKVKNVILNLSLYRRMPCQTVAADPEMYQFLTEHPDLVVGFWDVLGATQMSLQEVRPNQYQLKEDAGIVAVAEVLYRTSELCIIYAKGQYRGSFPARPCEGDVVLVLKTRFERSEDNRPLIVSNLDSFVHIDNIGVDLIAKLFATSLGKIADSNFEQTVAFVAYLSRVAAGNAEGVKQAVSRISTVSFEQKEEFCDVIDRVAQRAANRSRIRVPIPQYEIAAVPADAFALTSEDKADWFEPDELNKLPEPNSIQKIENRVADEDISAFLDHFTNDIDYRFPQENIKKNVPMLPIASPQEQPLPVFVEDSMLKETEIATTEKKNTTENSVPPVKKSKAVFGTPKIVRQ